MPRRFARLALALLTAATLVAAGVLTVLALGGGDWAVNLVLRKINPWPGTSLRAADVTGNLLTAPRLYRLSLTRADGEVMLRADSAAVRYDLRRLVAGDITLAEVRVYGADLILRQRDDGRWDLPAKRTRSPGLPGQTARRHSPGTGTDRGRDRAASRHDRRDCAVGGRRLDRRRGDRDPHRSGGHDRAGHGPAPGSSRRPRARAGHRPGPGVSPARRGDGAAPHPRLRLQRRHRRRHRAARPAERAWARPAAQPAGPQRPAVRAARPWRPAARARPTRQREDRGPRPRRGRRDGRQARRRAVRWRPGGRRRGGDVIRTAASALPRAGDRPGR